MSFRKFIHDNLVAIVIIPTIFGVHWFVNKIAEDESLVKPHERKDLPIVHAFHAIKNKLIPPETLNEEAKK